MKFRKVFPPCFFLILGLISISYGKERLSYPAEVIFQIVDDKGEVVEGADVKGYFLSPYAHDGVGDLFNLYTDKEGNCGVKGKGHNSMEVFVQANGYYRTELNISLGDERLARELGRWPLEEVTVTLKAKRNPIPMYAKRVVTNIPAQNKPVGFDMEKGDWVAPYGKGEVSDVDVIYSTNQEAPHRFEKRLEFSVPASNGGLILDGLDQYSTFLSCHDAPSDGYEAKFLFEQKRTPEKILVDKGNKENEYFILRSRVETNSVGEIKFANYSKIYGPIQYAVWRNQQYLEFIYYFNPTPNDRNLEFDTSRNLFTDERINRP